MVDLHKMKQTQVSLPPPREDAEMNIKRRGGGHKAVLSL
jgi:hypothetical protein